MGRSGKEEHLANMAQTRQRLLTLTFNLLYRVLYNCTVVVCARDSHSRA